MPTLEAVADSHQRRQAQLAIRTATRAAELWRQVDRGGIAASWRSLLPQLLAVVSTAQATATAGAGVYVEDALEAQGARLATAGRVATGSLAGIASDGRPLASLLYQPVIQTLTFIQQGASPPRALAGGLMSLDTIVRTQVADAGRAAESIAIAARPRVAGYVRMLSQPSCSRCIILAGKRYRWNAGFRRHPRCDCRHVPAVEDVADDVRTDPKLAFESMSRAEQERIFGLAGSKAIREGADIYRVVNARRGMQTATVFGREVQLTTEGTTTRGVAGRVLGARDNGTKRRATDRYASARRVRLMPEQILIEAKGNREEAIRLLKLHGYIF